jgi:multicopper oxidase
VATSFTLIAFALHNPVEFSAVILRPCASLTVHLEPMMMVQADIVPDNVGTWLFHCHVTDHIEGGMQALFTVLP